MKFWRVFHIFAVIARPILRIAGVKSGTTAAKVADAAAVVDAAVTAAEKDRGEQKPP